MDVEKKLDPEIVAKGMQISRLADVAYEAIRDAIVSGRIKPGEWLRQQALAQELGTSQLTVREALNRLVVGGLAVHEPYRGVRVVDLSIETMEEVYCMRAMLEGWAMELAAGRLSAEELARMRELLPRTADPDPQSAQAVRKANREFHWIAIHSTGKQHLIRVLEQLWELALTYVFRDWATGEERSETARVDLMDHTRLLEALEAGDGQQARQITEGHLYHTLDTNLERMRRPNQD